MSKRGADDELQANNAKTAKVEEEAAAAAYAAAGGGEIEVAAAADQGALGAMEPHEDTAGPNISAPYADGELAYWNQQFFNLLLYRVQNGHVNVKSTDEKHKELYKFVSQLRKDYRQRERSPESSPLTREQVQVLESVRFAFTTRGEEHWNKNFQKLKEFKATHGHVLVPRQCEIPGLGDWVTSQRQQFTDFQIGKPTPLSRQRKELLDGLGFQWRVRNRPEWNSKFDELVAYKEQHGDTRVPQHYAENKALGKWVAKQREQYKLKLKGKHSFLTADRMEMLNQIGFVWSVRGETALDPHVEAAASVMKDEPKVEDSTATPKEEETTLTATV